VLLGLVFLRTNSGTLSTEFLTPDFNILTRIPLVLPIYQMPAAPNSGISALSRSA
jgi:hypothetical protein